MVHSLLEDQTHQPGTQTITWLVTVYVILCLSIHDRTQFPFNSQAFKVKSQ